MNALYDLPAPAKLNLFLHVVGRRSDGYHLLESVFVPIDWCDTLHVERNPNGAIRRHDLGPALPPDDLIVRAARALQQASGTRLGADIQVLKTIPAQAGLGGGSSDAATTLLALNRLWSLGLTRAQLMTIGVQLGADVPFFLGGQPAWVSGIGDALRPLELAATGFMVIKPQRGLATAEIFSNPALKRDTDPAKLSSFEANPYRFGCNDLEPVAKTLCSDVSAALGWLEQRGLVGRMTGSGSAVFAQSTQDVGLANLPKGWVGRFCKSLEVHPLMGWA
ncbi:MAG: 4-(cytidine 5'-diphospho)-2-C-methyl-D-erythritol kinase [Rhodoferax sp.]